MPDMLGLSRSRTIFALAAILVTTLAVWLAAGIEAAGIALVGAMVAALIAAPPIEDDASDAFQPAPADDSVADAIEAIFEPVLLVAENRVIAANQAARTLLGEHILGEDVRVAIRHPAAAERLLSTEEASGRPVQPIVLIHHCPAPLDNAPVVPSFRRQRSSRPLVRAMSMKLPSAKM